MYGVIREIGLLRNRFRFPSTINIRTFSKVSRLDTSRSWILKISTPEMPLVRTNSSTLPGITIPVSSVMTWVILSVCRLFHSFDSDTWEDIFGKERPFLQRFVADKISEEKATKRLVPDDVKEAVRQIIDECREFDEKQRPSELQNGLQIDYVDWPLFNVGAVLEPDSVTGSKMIPSWAFLCFPGEKVLLEMEKLKRLLPLNNWGNAETKHFYFLDRVPNLFQAICRLCKFTPRSPFLFFEHLFSQQHCTALSKCVVPRKDFIFWEKQFTGIKRRELTSNNCNTFFLRIFLRRTKRRKDSIARKLRVPKEFDKSECSAS